MTRTERRTPLNSVHTNSSRTLTKLSLLDCLSARAADSLVRSPADSLGSEVTAAAAAAPQSYVDAIRTGLETTAKEQGEEQGETE